MRSLRFMLVLCIVLSSSFGLWTVASAHGEEHEGSTYVVLAGAAGPANIDVLAFAPQSLQIHRGDTVVWQFAGFHNVRFGDAPMEFIVVPMVDGQPMPQIAPEVAFASIESGATYTGGAAGSGLPFASPMFSLTFDVEPGTYGYFCDIHPGMVGTVTVVEDDVVIPEPSESFQMAAGEIGAHVGAGLGTYHQMMGEMEAMEMDMSAPAHVTAGTMAGAATIQQFFPSVVVIEAGQSVTWMVEAGPEPHTVTSLPLPPETDQLIFIPPAAEGDMPILAVGEPFTPNVVDGQEITTADAFNSGLILPTGTVTLTFTEPGVYEYGCFLHAGMRGAVVVMAASE